MVGVTIPVQYESEFGFEVRNDGAAFQGSEALAKAKRAPLKRMLATFTVDDPNVVLLGRETIFRDSQQVGYLTSGGYGYTLATNIGMGYVRSGAKLTRIIFLQVPMNWKLLRSTCLQRFIQHHFIMQKTFASGHKDENLTLFAQNTT